MAFYRSHCKRPHSDMEDDDEFMPPVSKRVFPLQIKPEPNGLNPQNNNRVSLSLLDGNCDVAAVPHPYGLESLSGSCQPLTSYMYAASNGQFQSYTYAASNGQSPAYMYAASNGQSPAYMYAASNGQSAHFANQSEQQQMAQHEMNKKLHPTQDPAYQASKPGCVLTAPSPAQQWKLDPSSGHGLHQNDKQDIPCLPEGNQHGKCSLPKPPGFQPFCDESLTKQNSWAGSECVSTFSQSTSALEGLPSDHSFQRGNCSAFQDINFQRDQFPAFQNVANNNFQGEHFPAFPDLQDHSFQGDQFSAFQNVQDQLPQGSCYLNEQTSGSFAGPSMGNNSGDVCGYNKDFHLRQLPNGPYDPELGMDENPHYFSINQVLFEAHVDRVNRDDGSTGSS